jgi:phage terminase small subunit
MPRPKNPAKRPTIKQQKFTAEIIKSLGKKGRNKEDSGTQAAIKAGYSPKSARFIASENLTKPNIIEPIRSAAEKLGISPEYVLGGVKEIFEFNKQKRVKAKKVGEETFHEEEMIDAQASLKAGDLLGKHLKLFTEQLDVKASVETKTDEEQEKAIAKRAALLLMKNSLE